ncbi:MAG: DNA polymerase III subunit alpha [Paracoccaceae bacterium]
MSGFPKYIHLRVHTEYSLLEGATRLKKLPELCKANDMPAIALTETNNLFSALEFSVLFKDNGLQPIIGCQIDFRFTDMVSERRARTTAPIVLIAQDELGYKNLMKLSSEMYVQNDDEKVEISIEKLERYADGLICLTGGSRGPLGELILAAQDKAARDLLLKFQNIFSDRLYLELQRHPQGAGLPKEENDTEPVFIEMAYDLSIPLIATNDVYFDNIEMYEAHDALLCIADGAYVDQQEPRRTVTNQHYFKTQEEMAALFADLPEALESTVEVAQRCAFMATCRDPILPLFASDEITELNRQAKDGLKNRLAIISHAAPVSEYEERLDFELKIIEQMGFPGYFLIVADFIKWAKEKDIPVGPGRGSGAGSLVAYALTITDLDPLRYNLLFERFLNPDRVSMPDFDIDFCMDRREEVIQYVQQKYGHDKVGQIITFGALLSKAAIRDMGRVLQMPYGQVDRLAKLIPIEGVKPLSIEQALAEEPRLKEEAEREEVVDRLLNYGQKVEGLLRNAATHAAGIVISDRPLDDLVPVYKDSRSNMPATQFNMKWVEQAGLVKFDFLGLKTLTAIQNAIDLIIASGRSLHQSADGRQLFQPIENAENQINTIPLDDKSTYDLYASARTVAVFQVESSGMMDALKRMKPTSIEDIVALVALYRPGPMENIATYCDVKNGVKDRVSIHPMIDHILEETQGIIVYQEQVMQIAQIMAGYSLGEADLLRRAMGKKIKAAMDAERPKFEAGAKNNGISAKKASEIFDLLEKFANYGFNKSHAAAYAVVSYQTAWLKANHPLEFMAGAMNCDLHLTDKLSQYVDEVRKGLKLPFISPCVNRSQPKFSVSENSLVYGLAGLKNVGLEAMGALVNVRNNKVFVNLFDFARRLDLRKIGKRPLEMLVQAGAFDVLDNNRHRVFKSLDALVAYSAAIHDQKTSKQVSLFGDGGDDLPEPVLPSVSDWLPAERLSREFSAIGFYVTGHPLDDYKSAFKVNQILTIEEVEEKALSGPCLVKIAGVVVGRQERKSARGNRFAFVQLSDFTGNFEVTLFSEVLEKSRNNIESGARIILTVEASIEGEQLKLLCRSIANIDEAISTDTSHGIKIFVEDKKVLPSIISVLDQASENKKIVSKGPIHLCLIDPGLPGEVELDTGLNCDTSPQIRGAIKSLDGVLDVQEI